LKTKIAVVFYLLTIVAANLIVSSYGMVNVFAGISVVHVTAFLLIAPDFTLRDYIHDKWKDNWKKNMSILIITGSIITYLLNTDSLNIAVASTVAFFSAAVIDSIVYKYMEKHKWFYRVNTSNFLSTVTDSIIFLSIAFGFSIVPIIIQILAKYSGAFIWSLILNKEYKKEVVYVE